ncbi:MAG TPA: nitrogen fixation protein NifM [Gammaproteobacteria bacterium]|nr:nitrogen fixation protein NifM [Gammaproteobacteria bacterium]
MYFIPSPPPSPIGRGGYGANTVATINMMTDKVPEYAYHLLRSALEKFGKTPAELTADQITVVHTQADATFELETRALSSPDAHDIVISEQRIDEALQGIARRYESREAFLSDLNKNDLSESLLRTALYRELLFDAVLAHVAAQSAEVSDSDILLFYEAHRERFACRETRVARHILVTVNPEFSDNTREKAEQRMAKIQKHLCADPTRFAELARKHSECPSALEGGKLGRLPQGKLYPALDEALFRLAQGGVSDIVETELGLHLLYCEKIHPAQTASLSEARLKIREIIQQRQRRHCQKIWLDELKS